MRTLVLDRTGRDLLANETGSLWRIATAAAISIGRPPRRWADAHYDMSSAASVSALRQFSSSRDRIVAAQTHLEGG
jgi:hypothetical protein